MQMQAMNSYPNMDMGMQGEDKMGIPGMYGMGMYNMGNFATTGVPNPVNPPNFDFMTMQNSMMMQNDPNDPFQGLGFMDGQN